MPRRPCRRQRADHCAVMGASASAFLKVADHELHGGGARSGSDVQSKGGKLALGADVGIGAGALQLKARTRRHSGGLAVYKPTIHVLPVPVPLVPVGAWRGSACAVGPVRVGRHTPCLHPIRTGCWCRVYGTGVLLAGRRGQCRADHPPPAGQPSHRYRAALRPQT